MEIRSPKYRRFPRNLKFSQSLATRYEYTPWKIRIQMRTTRKLLGSGTKSENQSKSIFGLTFVFTIYYKYGYKYRLPESWPKSPLYEPSENWLNTPPLLITQRGANYEYSICVMKKLYCILKREKTSFLSVVLKNSRSLHSNGDYATPNL